MSKQNMTKDEEKASEEGKGQQEEKSKDQPSKSPTPPGEGNNEPATAIMDKTEALKEKGAEAEGTLSKKKASAKESLFSFLNAMASQRHLVALRDGMLASIPIILAGSTFLLLGSQQEVISNYLPFVANSPFGAWYSSNWQSMLVPFRFTMGILSVFVAFSIAASLAKSYGMPMLPQAMGAVAAFLLTMKPVRAVINAGQSPEWVIPLRPLGGDGLFLAIIAGLATVEISRLTMGLWNKALGKDRKKDDKAEEKTAIPAAVSEAFISFLPVLCVITIVWAVTYLFNVDIYTSLITAMKPMEALGDTAVCVVAVNVFMHIFGFAGLHGISVINGVFFALWQKFLLLNTEVHTLNPGAVLPTVTAYPFYQWFVWIGGQGTTFSVPLMLLFFKNAHLKRIGKISLIPSLFNVNEPLLFGLPVVVNPIFAIPFVLAPICCGLTSFFAFSLNLVTRPFIEVPWVLPSFFGAPLCCQDMRALVLLGVNLAISALIWLPFLKAYEKKLEQRPEEQACPEGAKEDSPEDKGEKREENPKE